VIDTNGFRFTVQKSNCLQANVYLNKDIFTRFECEGNHQLGINLLLLLDFLSMLGPNSGNQVALHFSNKKKNPSFLVNLDRYDRLRTGIPERTSQYETDIGQIYLFYIYFKVVPFLDPKGWISRHF
jgi:hypothetical protein